MCTHVGMSEHGYSCTSVNRHIFSTVPTGTPQSLVNTSATVSNITIQWDRLDCLDRNGNITLYRVRYGLTTSTERVPMTH